MYERKKNEIEGGRKKGKNHQKKKRLRIKDRFFKNIFKVF